MKSDDDFQTPASAVLLRTLKITGRMPLLNQLFGMSHWQRAKLKSVRKRLADEDGLCGKFHTDCLRYAGFIPDDRPEICSIRTTQRKAAKGEDEHTLIEVFQIAAPVSGS